jgi:PilZ domain
MRYDLRKDHRVELNYIARVLSLGGETICDCALLDVSQGGARIEVLASEIVPDEFLLVFSKQQRESKMQGRVAQS